MQLSPVGQTELNPRKGEERERGVAPVVPAGQSGQLAVRPLQPGKVPWDAHFIFDAGLGEPSPGVGQVAVGILQ